MVIVLYNAYINKRVENIQGEDILITLHSTKN